MESKINILVIITTSFVPYGGLTSVMMNYYRGLDKTKFHVDFASTNDDLDNELIAELEKWQSSYYSLGSRKKNLCSYILKLNRLLENNRYDIVHVNSNSATAAIELQLAKKNNVKKRIIHNHTSICNHKLFHRMMYPFFIASYTDAIACSVKAGEWIFGDKQYTVLNNGINSDAYRFNESYRNEIRSRYNIPAGAYLIGHLGKIYKPKNHHFLISLFADYYRNHPESYLILVGDGDMRNEIEEDVRHRGLLENVIFAGMQKEVNKYLSAMDMFLFPSLWEGMPLSMIEAQASGLFCLVSDRVDKAVDVTGNVLRLSIEDTSPWIKALELYRNINRQEQSNMSISKIKQAHYDSLINAKILEKLYLGNL